jgi:outer membrane protein OmpA-like peptidoglycan-associated protein
MLNYRLNGSLYYASDAALAAPIEGFPTIRALENGHAVEAGISQLYTGDLSATFGVHRVVDITADLPLYADIAGWGLTRNTVGDLSVAATYSPSRPIAGPLSGGVRLSVTAPTGNSENGIFPRHVYYLRRDPTFARYPSELFIHNKAYVHPQLLGSIKTGGVNGHLPFELHLNLGSTVSDARESMTFDGAFACAVHPLKQLFIAVEASGEWRPFVPGRGVISTLRADPFRIVPSIGLDLPAGFTLTAAGDIGLSQGNSTLRSNLHRGGCAFAVKSIPMYAAAVGLTYRGSVRKVFARKKTENLVTGLPGDRDGDGVPDSLDACPGTPEDGDGFSDADGCPDYDNDADGIPDEIDKCPYQPEDIDRFEDKDGCPDADNDADRISDSLDACPNDKGTEGNRGCPETGELTFVRAILTSVAFEPGSSKIVSGTDVLDRIFKELQKNTSASIEFQVHTDNRGSLENCRLLSQSRADVLKLYLVAKGIRPDRIKSLGMGSEFPIADNSTDTGRAKNQRVEVRRIQ